MAYKFYKAVTDDGGDVGTQISSGEVNALFNRLELTELISGSVKNRKVYIESDADLTCYVGISGLGDYDQSLFASAGNSEVVGDLTGNEAKYGGVPVLSATLNTFTYTIGLYDLFSHASWASYAGKLFAVSSYIDNGDGTATVTVGSDFPNTPAQSDVITSVLPLSLTAAIPVPFWRVNSVAAASSPVSEYNSVTILALG